MRDVTSGTNAIKNTTKGYNAGPCQLSLLANHRHAGCRVDHFIDLAGLEAGGEINVVRIGDDAPPSSRANDQLSRGIVCGGASSPSRTSSTAFGLSRSSLG